MLDAGAYLLAAAETVGVIAAVAFFAYRLRGRVLPAWHGAPARLAEAIFGIAFAVGLGQLLGTANLLHEGTYLAGCALGALAAIFWLKPGAEGDREPDPPAVPALGLWATLGVVGLLFTHWGVETKQSLDAGIGNFDSLWYHMPFSVEIAQSGSTTGLIQTETVFLNWFYPQNSELLHSVGILLTERDFLSLFINFGWLALALLAAWVIGRPFGRGHLTVALAAVVLECHTLVVREPGAAKNDIVAAALVLAAAALLLTWWESARRTKAARQVQGEGASESEAPAESDFGAVGWWGLAVAGLAAGLAAGTKLTALALVASLTVAAVALAPAGRRRAAAGWWGLPMLLGGAYWYVRNLFAAANPIPQVRELGPLSLPGPDRLQEGRPDFSVAHYATDTDIWRDYFEPGFNEAFGDLWPLVLLAGVVGVALAILQRSDRGLRALGIVAGVGMAAYLVTPLSAAGAEGAPEAFGINIRFLIPSLLLALALLPLGPAFGRPRAAWSLLAGTLLALVITNSSIDILRTHERIFGLGLAFLVVLIPAGMLLARRRGASGGLLAGGAAVLVAVVIAIGYPVQREYFEDRFAEPDVFGLDVAYTWANETSDERIGLAGTTAGFMGLGLYGPDLSNDVDYLGQEAPKGGFDAIPTCEAFRRAVNEADLDYLVTAPFLNFIDPGRPITSPETRWLRGSGGLTVIRRDGAVRVWRVDGPLRESCGPENRPLREVPDQPGI